MSVCLVQRAQSRPPDRRMFALKNRFEKNEHLLVQKFRFRRLQRLYAIQAEPFFSSSLNKAKRGSTHRVNQSKNNWCKQEQQILNSCYRKKQRSGGSRPSDKGGGGGGGHPDLEIRGCRSHSLVSFTSVSTRIIKRKIKSVVVTYLSPAILFFSQELVVA